LTTPESIADSILCQRSLPTWEAMKRCEKYFSKSYRLCGNFKREEIE
jgi:hypothetical protein